MLHNWVGSLLWRAALNFDIDRVARGKPRHASVGGVIRNSKGKFGSLLFGGSGYQAFQ